MKKTIVLLSALAVVLFSSCKEQVLKSIDFGRAGDDTTYRVANVSQPQQKHVLVEEFTGVSCSNCPDAATMLKSIVSNNSGKVVVIGYHPTNIGLTKPIDKDGHKSQFDFRQPRAEELGSTIFGGIPGMPIAVIERQQINNNYFVGRTEWSKLIEDRLLLSTPVNIDVVSNVDENAGEAVVLVKLEYTDNVPMKQNFHVVIIENGIIDAQEGRSVIYDDYEHEHVFRRMLTPLAGAIIPTKVDPKEPGKVYEKTFTVELDSKWNIDNCKVVVYVTNDEVGNKEVVQVAETTLKN